MAFAAMLRRNRLGAWRGAETGRAGGGGGPLIRRDRVAPHSGSASRLGSSGCAQDLYHLRADHLDEGVEARVGQVNVVPHVVEIRREAVR
jgi:hypothetical protein